MDVLEMAVYGNVKRKGLLCRCKSVREMLDGRDMEDAQEHDLPNCK